MTKMTKQYQPKFVKKPWGHELIWALTADYVGKMIHIDKGHRLSRQFHKQKEETIQILDGDLVLEIGDPQKKDFQTLNLSPGDTFHITPGLIHRFCSHNTPVVICEVSTPQLDDVVRLADDYKR